ncbi:MAG: hypothetical protein ACRC1P_09760 [Cellulosilyticaceae bacterium]
MNKDVIFIFIWIFNLGVVSWSKDYRYIKFMAILGCLMGVSNYLSQII